MIGKHHNLEYDGGSPNIPVFLKDKYYAGDLNRDYQYRLDRLGHNYKDLYVDPPYILDGGQVSQGAGTTLNITVCIAVVKYNVTVPGTFGALPPPPILTEKLEAIRVISTVQTNLAIPNAVNDGATTNYVKLAYADLDGNTRQRARKIGTYVYEQAPSFTITVDDDAPAGDGTEVLLDTFTLTGGGVFTFGVATNTRDSEYKHAIRKPSVNLIINAGTTTLSPVHHFQQLHITGSCTIRGRVIIVEEDFVIDSGMTLAFDNYTNLIVSPAGIVAGDQNISRKEIMSPGKGGTNIKLAGGGYGGYTANNASGKAGAGGYTTEGGDSAGNAGGLPFITIASFGLAAGIGGNGGSNSAAEAAGGGGIGGGGGYKVDTGGDGGPAVLIIVKGNFINSGTITVNGKLGVDVGDGGGGGGCLIVATYGSSNTMGNLNVKGADGQSNGSTSGGGGGHIATIRASGGAPTTDISGGTGAGTGSAGSAGTELHLDLASNPEYGLANWGSTDAGILTANFIYQVFGYGWSVYK